jgi:hypothetical protein
MLSYCPLCLAKLSARTFLLNIQLLVLMVHLTHQTCVPLTNSSGMDAGSTVGSSCRDPLSREHMRSQETAANR